jgi:hypothetical protein
MRLDGNHGRDEQFELSERVTFGAGSIPRVRPTVDPELEEMFIRAASAWARWRERQRWSGQ